MQGSRVVVSMGRQAIGKRMVRRDTHRARAANTLAVGASHEEIRLEDDLDTVLLGFAVQRAKLLNFWEQGGSSTPTHS